METPPPFITYAQNREDVVLNRALSAVTNGFYVDIGAAHPIFDSVTKAFYDRGWSGINVEPSSQYTGPLNDERKRDQNFDCVISNEEGEKDFYEIAGTGNSSLDAQIAQRNVQQGYDVVERSVRSISLSTLLQEARVPDDVHFLKIDVEGSEKQVLSSADFSKFRPWIIIVEATIPDSPELNHEEWESILLESRYEFALFDGLNRFYFAEEHSELADALSRPACVFDSYIPLREHLLQNRLDRLRQKLKKASRRQSRLESLATENDMPPSPGNTPGYSGENRSNQESREAKLRGLVRDRNSELVELAQSHFDELTRIYARSRLARLLMKLLPSVHRQPRESALLAAKVRRDLKLRIQRMDEIMLGNS